MNRSTFFKKCLALVGFGAIVNTVKSEEPTVSTPSNTITLNKLQITDGKSTYVLVVENEVLHIRKVKSEEEQVRVANANPYVINPITQPTSFIHLA